MIIQASGVALVTRRGAWCDPFHPASRTRQAERTPASAGERAPGATERVRGAGEHTTQVR